jgi:hypothetical protein
MNNSIEVVASNIEASLLTFHNRIVATIAKSADIIPEIIVTYSDTAGFPSEVVAEEYTDNK